jgi:hypothetical protein
MRNGKNSLICSLPVTWKLLEVNKNNSEEKRSKQTSNKLERDKLKNNLSKEPPK